MFKICEACSFEVPEILSLYEVLYGPCVQNCYIVHPCITCKAMCPYSKAFCDAILNKLFPGFHESAYISKVLATF